MKICSVGKQLLYSSLINEPSIKFLINLQDSAEVGRAGSQVTNSMQCNNYNYTPSAAVLWVRSRNSTPLVRNQK
jgi:hypothetical protein